MTTRPDVMTPRERFLSALAGRPVDRVPYFEYSVHSSICEALIGEPLKRDRKKEINRAFGICDIELWRKPPVFVEEAGVMHGRAYQGHGAIRTRDDLPRMVLPPPAPTEVLEAAHKLTEEKEEFAAGLVISLGPDPMLLSMGYEGFSYAQADDPELPLEILKRYCEWVVRLLEAMRPFKFDFVLAGDDMAHKTGPFFSPAWFHEKALPIIRQVAKATPWPLVLHCDGNLEPLLPGILELGVVGVHPMEPEAVDIFAFKRKYGHRLTVIGNVDVNNLSLGTPESVRAEARDKLARLSPGGRYVIASSSCVPEYVQPANYQAMVNAIREFSAAPV